MAKKGNKGKGKGKGGSFSVGGYQQPPPFSYDPSIEAERRAAQRGLGDLLKDLKLEKKYGRQDFRTGRKDIRLTETRGKEDFSTKLHRGLGSIGEQRADVGTRQTRGREDFATEMANLTRRFNQQGAAQRQGAVAAGVQGGGALTASRRARSENFTLARQPLDTGLARMETDTATDISRLGTREGELREDVRTGRTRLGEDTSHDLGLAKRDWRRSKKDIKLRRGRGVREQRISDLDLIKQEIFQARQLKPGSFTTRGRSS